MNELSKMCKLMAFVVWISHKSSSTVNDWKRNIFTSLIKKNVEINQVMGMVNDYNKTEECR